MAETVSVGPDLASSSQALTWWQAVLEEAPAQVELPRCGESAATAVSVAGSADDDRLACVVAGLVARYSPTGTAVLTIGHAGSWIPLAVDFADNPTCSDAAQRVHDARSAALAHELSLTELLAAVGPSVAQVTLSLDGTAWPAGSDVAALAIEVADSIVVRCPSGAATEIAGHLGRLLDDWTGERRLADVDILSGRERSGLMVGAAGAATALPEGTVWDQIARHVATTPEAPALVDDTETLTYGELGTRVDSLAAHLAAGNIGAGDLVGLCVHRSVRMVVGLLAILRSGAAYVPIDPTYPRERVAMMVEDARLTTVVTDTDLLDQLPDGVQNGIAIDTESAAADAPLPAKPTADDLAYVIFTSGSTGRPKGVMIGHRALLNFVGSIAREPGLSAHDRLLAVTTLSFDIAALELLVPLVVGGCVVVAGRDTVLDPDALIDRMERHDITVMQATPATWRMLVDSGWDGRPGLRVLCGGEALPSMLAAELQTRCAELWNMYGPTETTIWSLVTRLRQSDPVTIGRPMENTTVYVAGQHQELLPDGLAGELLIGGLGLADGYLGRPDLTEQRFVPDLVTGGADRAPTGRLYRTGDLVRRRADGRLEFLSRMDNQVKVRGFRIELGEVETVLDAHPDVARSVAVVIPDPASGTNRLVAYAVAVPGATLDGSLLRRHAGDSLPAYMVPSAVVVLDEFPLTLNGKIDRKVLPAPQLADREVAPARTPVEHQLVQLWQDVLKVTPIGIQDDVFELGTSSLTIARLYARMAAELDIRLPIAAAFGAPTIEHVAALVADRHDGRITSGHASLVPIRPDGTRRPLFLVHGGAGTVLLFEPLARRLDGDQPVYALQAAGLYGDRSPQNRVPDMAALYVDELRSVQPHGPYRLGGYCYGALVAFEMARLLAQAGERTELLVAFNGSSPSYIRQYRPLFDADGARTDEKGDATRPAPGIRGRIAEIWQQRESFSGFLAALSRRALGMAEALARRAKFHLLLESSVRLHRPLPEALRESGAFQHLSVAAQERYDPPPYDGDMVVVRAAGMYHRDDLGWSDHVTGRVDVVEVPGAQLTPRDSMKDAFVAPIVAAVGTRLAAADGTDAEPVSA